MGATAAVSEKYLSCMETFIKGELLQELQELKNEVGQFTRKVGELKSEIHCKDEELLRKERQIEEMRIKFEQNNSNAVKDNIIIASLTESVKLKDEEIKELKRAIEDERRLKSAMTVKQNEASDTNKVEPPGEFQLLHQPNLNIDMIQQSVTQDTCLISLGKQDQSETSKLTESEKASPLPKSPETRREKPKKGVM